MTNFTSGFVDGITPMLVVIGEIAESFGEMDKEGQQLAGNVSGWAQSINSLFSALDSFKSVLIGIAGITGFNQLVTFLATIGSAKTAASIGVLGKSLSDLSLSTSGLVGAFAGLVGSGAIGWQIGTWLNSFEGVQNAAQGFWAWTDQVLNWSGNADAVKEAGKQFGGGFQEGIKEQFKEPTIADEDFSWWDDIIKEYEANNPVVVEVGVKTDIPSGPVMYTWVDDDGTVHFSDSPGNSANETTIPIDVAPTVDEEKAEAAVDKTKTYIEEIKLTAETVQTAMEWSAKVDIANIEANAKIVESTFDSMNVSIDAASKAIGGLLDAWTSDDLSFLDRSIARGMLEDELELKREIWEVQKKLIEAQIAMKEAQADAIERGDSQIKIDTTGVEPALEMVMWQIIEKVQIQANANAQAFLLGLPA